MIDMNKLTELLEASTNITETVDVSATKALEDALDALYRLQENLPEAEYYYILDAITRAKEAIEIHEATTNCEINLDSE